MDNDIWTRFSVVIMTKGIVKIEGLKITYDGTYICAYKGDVQKGLCKKNMAIKDETITVDIYQKENNVQFIVKDVKGNIYGDAFNLNVKEVTSALMDTKFTLGAYNYPVYFDNITVETVSGAEIPFITPEQNIKKDRKCQKLPDSSVSYKDCNYKYEETIGLNQFYIWNGTVEIGFNGIDHLKPKDTLKAWSVNIGEAQYTWKNCNMTTWPFNIKCKFIDMEPGLHLATCDFKGKQFKKRCEVRNVYTYTKIFPKITDLQTMTGGKSTGCFKGGEEVIITGDNFPSYAHDLDIQLGKSFKVKKITFVGYNPVTKQNEIWFKIPPMTDSWPNESEQYLQVCVDSVCATGNFGWTY